MTLATSSACAARLMPWDITSISPLIVYLPSAIMPMREEVRYLSVSMNEKVRELKLDFAAFMSKYIEGCTNITTGLTDIPAEWLPFVPSPQPITTAPASSTDEVITKTNLPPQILTSTIASFQSSTMALIPSPPDTAAPTTTSLADPQIPICGVRYVSQTDIQVCWLTYIRCLRSARSNTITAFLAELMTSNVFARPVTR